MMRPAFIAFAHHSLSLHDFTSVDLKRFCTQSKSGREVFWVFFWNNDIHARDSTGQTSFCQKVQMLSPLLPMSAGDLVGCIDTSATSS